MGKLRKNHVKRIYKKTYDKSPSVAKILKTVLTTSFKYALRYGYVEEDYVSGLKWNRVIKKLSKSGQKKALTNSGKEIYVRGYNNDKMDYLISEIEKTVAVAKEHLTGAVNQTMTEIYWRIGRYIVEFE